jgi:hypothetical protein
VSPIFNHEEHLLRVLADTGTNSSIILDAYTLAPFIQTDDSNTTTWNSLGGKYTTNKDKYTCELFTLRIQSQEIICTSWAFHVDDCSESSSIHDMIIGQG